MKTPIAHAKWGFYRGENRDSLWAMWFLRLFENIGYSDAEQVLPATTARGMTQSSTGCGLVWDSSLNRD